MLLSVLIVSLLFRRFVLTKNLKTSFFDLVIPNAYAEKELGTESADELTPFGYYYLKTKLNHQCQNSLGKSILSDPQRLLSLNEKKLFEAQELNNQLRNSPKNYFHEFLSAYMYLKIKKFPMGTRALENLLKKSPEQRYFEPCTLGAIDFIKSRDEYLKNYQLLVEDFLVLITDSHLKKLFQIYHYSFHPSFQLKQMPEKLNKAELEEILKINTYGKRYFYLWFKFSQLDKEQMVDFVNSYIPSPLLNNHFYKASFIFESILPGSLALRDVFKNRLKMPSDNFEKWAVINLLENRTYKDYFFEVNKTGIKNISNLKRNYFLELLEKREGCQFAYKKLEELGEDINPLQSKLEKCLSSGF